MHHLVQGCCDPCAVQYFCWSDMNILNSSVTHMIQKRKKIHHLAPLGIELSLRIYIHTSTLQINGSAVKSGTIYKLLQQLLH